MRNNSSKAEPSGVGRYLKPIGFSVLVGAVVCTLALLLCSFIFTIRDIPQSLVSPISTVCAAAGAFAAGLCCAKLIRERGLAFGLICGVFLFLLTLFCGWLIVGGEIGILALIKLVVILIAAAIGGVAGVNGKRRHK